MVFFVTTPDVQLAAFRARAAQLAESLQELGTQGISVRKRVCMRCGPRAAAAYPGKSPLVCCQMFGSCPS